MDLIVGRPALLVVDMQHDFLDAGVPLEAAGGRDIVPAVAATIAAARRAVVPVIYTQEAHRPGRVDCGREADPGTGDKHNPAGPAGQRLPEHCVEGTTGIEIVPQLAPAPGELTVRKRRYSCFLGTELDLLLRELQVQTLLVTGVDSDVCVLWTVGEAYQRDYHVRVLEDCVAGTSAAAHQAALLIMRELTTGRPVLSAEAVRALGALEAAPS